MWGKLSWGELSLGRDVCNSPRHGLHVCWVEVEIESALEKRKF